MSDIDDVKMDFLLMGAPAGLRFNPALPGGLHFLDPISRVEIKLDVEGLFRPLVCRAYLSIFVRPSVVRFVSSLLVGRFESYEDMPISLPYVKYGATQIDANGNIAKGFGVPFEMYPPQVQSACDTVEASLLQTVERFLRLLRWQQNIDGPHFLFEGSPSLYWRIEGDAYRHVGLRVQNSEGASPAGIEWKHDDQADLETLWLDQAADEPLAHELLREAKNIAEHSPRSSFLVATSALEVGTKAYVAHLRPETAWLLAELPAPPIHKMLRTYIPDLHTAQGTPLTYWDKLRPLFKRVEANATTRNKLTHTGRVSISPELLESHIQDISDILYLFDLLKGHEWAKHNLSHSLRSALGWPASRRTRHRVSLRVGGI
ncbi:hypothetical protein NLM27_32085 [Bradyrhizobium sp. CCGB12]|uniref:hypothetical protein n=1 Tax=Bradyrhizobium sp. CCGB12 TaxID=2949632 RepID=UPI0020B3899A|nr:hypothetical protein [Bradyrhizobium sp. CCGB12]MCP3393398.1 hypothetical protein [Bradyrhizobium sp. CCGB12]